MSYEDIQKLQSVGKAAQEANAKFILRNDLPRVWEHIKGLKGGRVDFVLDNGGSDCATGL
jgi:damage-control phosphatase, subfamily III